jgi:hypothetical protein
LNTPRGEAKKKAHKQAKANAARANLLEMEMVKATINCRNFSKKSDFVSGSELKLSVPLIKQSNKHNLW